jgi:hypothetical protein
MDPLIFGGVMKGVNKVLDIADPTARRKAWQEYELKLSQQDVELRIKQMDTNTEEAKHDSLFVAGGRPSIMWVCSAGLAMAFPVRYAFELMVYMYLVLWVGAHDTIAPVFDITQLITLLTGMLGLSVIRSNEKIKGVSRETMSLDKKKRWWKFR